MICESIRFNLFFLGGGILALEKRRVVIAGTGGDISDLFEERRIVKSGYLESRRVDLFPNHFVSDGFALL
jgi:hypothetical protein